MFAVGLVKLFSWWRLVVAAGHQALWSELPDCSSAPRKSRDNSGQRLGGSHPRQPFYGSVLLRGSAHGGAVRWTHHGRRGFHGSSISLRRGVTGAGTLRDAAHDARVSVAGHPPTRRHASRSLLPQPVGRTLSRGSLQGTWRHHADGRPAALRGRH